MSCLLTLPVMVQLVQPCCAVVEPLHPHAAPGGPRFPLGPPPPDPAFRQQTPVDDPIVRSLPKRAPVKVLAQDHCIRSQCTTCVVSLPLKLSTVLLRSLPLEGALFLSFT